MLFYQRVSDQNSPVLPKKSRVSVVRQEAEDLSLYVLCWYCGICSVGTCSYFVDKRFETLDVGKGTVVGGKVGVI